MKEEQDMEVILLKDMEKLGYANDIVTVKPGYANNYLIPQGYAKAATASAKKVLAENLRQRAHKDAKILADAQALAETIANLLSMAVKVGNSSIFVGKKEFEIMKKPGRGTNGHIAILTNNVDRAIYHLGQRGVKFDMDSKNVKDGKTIAIYFADEIAGFAFHLVQR